MTEEAPTTWRQLLDHVLPTVPSHIECDDSPTGTLSWNGAVDKLAMTNESRPAFVVVDESLVPRLLDGLRAGLHDSLDDMLPARCARTLAHRGFCGQFSCERAIIRWLIFVSMTVGKLVEELPGIVDQNVFVDLRTPALLYGQQDDFNWLFFDDGVPEGAFLLSCQLKRLPVALRHLHGLERGGFFDEENAYWATRHEGAAALCIRVRIGICILT